MSTAPDPRTPDQISSDIDVTRNRLAGTIDTLVYRVHPKTIASRQIATTKGQFVNDDGSPNRDNLAKAAAVAAGVIAAVLLIRKLAG